MDYRKLTSPCGIDCFNCEIFKDNITDEFRKKIAPYLETINKDPETFYCKGCRTSGCVFILNECATKKCVEAKGLEFCSDCDSFPCNKFHPCLDGADKRPHNMKVFNLCRIKSIGFDEWVKETKMNRGKYFKGKLIIGSGPKIDESK